MLASICLPISNEAGQIEDSREIGGMRKSILITCGLFLSSLLAASEGTSPLVGFFGEWAGLGKMFGREVFVGLSWTPTLGGRFSNIHLFYRSLDDDQQFEFEGTGYYRADSDSHFTGTWLDSQGHIHPLTADLQDEALTASWGTVSTELGQSVYRLLENGHLEVIDSVKNENGEWQGFSRAVLSRK